MNLLRPPCDESVVNTRKPAKTRCGKAQGRWTLAATILGSSMVFIDGTVVNVALPALQTKLNATATDVQWVVEAYTLFLAALLLFGGSLGDRIGDAIKRLMEDSALRSRLIDGGKRTVREKFTWEIVLPQYQKLLGI